MTEHTETKGPSEVRCTQCGASRLKRENGSPGACSLIGCPSPLFDVDVEEGRRAPPPRRLAIAFNRQTNRIDVEPADRATYAWLHQRNVVEFLASKLPEMKGVRIVKDPFPGERPPPAGVMTPTLVAAWMQDALRVAFPDEDIAVQVATSDDRVHPACPSCTCGKETLARSSAD